MPSICEINCTVSPKISPGFPLLIAGFTKTPFNIQPHIPPMPCRPKASKA
ncbi:hypothetical protein [Candidatus Endomicrobiellum trichonymphae]|nr:hypothetical protein [Candidatus Endomicrobium trichonymphae]